MRSITEIRQKLDAGSYDKLLSQIYCRPASQLPAYRDRIVRVTEGFQTTFDKDRETEVSLFSAPGRTEIGGNHTDHQRGKVLTGSVDLDALACASPNGTSVVNLYSEGYGLISIDCDRLSPVKSERNTTKAIIRGVVAKIAALGYPVSGFDAYVISDVPGGSGLSSSACFEVLIGTVINGLFCENVLSMAEIAKIGQYAENVYFGKPSGLLDQMGCALGGIVAIDFKEQERPEIRSVDFDFASAGYALCIIDTGADHSDLTGDYAAVPAEMRAVADVLGKDVLSEVKEADFYAAIPEIRKKSGDRAVLRAIHYFNDCRRVDKQVAALESADFDRFLRLVNESGKSSFTYLQNIATYCNSADQPVAVALAVAEHLLGGRGASRVHGGGFAGTIQAFVPLEMVDAFRKGMDGLLGDGACRVTFIRPVGGCTLAE